MKPARRIPDWRLHNQHITRPYGGTAAGLVAWLGAVQAQEYPFAKWGLALRLGIGANDADLERAFDEGKILRTHVLRPTWHFVAPTDIRWMLELTAPRVHTSLAAYTRSQGIDRALLTRAISVFERSLEGGRFRTRAELGAALRRARMTLTPIQLGLVTMYAELERVICSGPRLGKQFTYALLDERVQGRSPARRTGDEALGELARRFFRSHGPATVRDYVWWSGLKTADARRGLEIIGAGSVGVDGVTYWYLEADGEPAPAKHTVHLLPIYDEYLVAYRDRAAVPHGPRTVHANGRSLSFRHSVVVGGQVAATWTLTGDRRVRVTPLRAFTAREQRGIAAAVERYASFLGAAVTVSF